MWRVKSRTQFSKYRIAPADCQEFHKRNETSQATILAHAPSESTRVACARHSIPALAYSLCMATATARADSVLSQMCTERWSSATNEDGNRARVLRCRSRFGVQRHQAGASRLNHLVAFDCGAQSAPGRPDAARRQVGRLCPSGGSASTAIPSSARSRAPYSSAPPHPA